MKDASMVMAYQNNVVELYSEGFSKPVPIEPKIKKFSSTPSGKNLILTFERPLKDPRNSSYFEIKDELQDVMLVYNSIENPKSSQDFSLHTNTKVEKINWYTRRKFCEF
jgi:hypothetical protein